MQILIDNKNSWIIPYAKKLLKLITKKNINAKILHEHKNISKGDVLILLSCEKILNNLGLNDFNLVVHESYLPKGKGWSPLTWQILEGKTEIPITLFEATNKVDSGKIYEQEIIHFDGSELIDELREKQGNKTIELIMSFLNKYPNVNGIKQHGEGSFYKKRSSEDSALDPNKSIAEQFNLLRIVDNERYPAFFEYRNNKYKIIIEKYE